MTYSNISKISRNYQKLSSKQVGFEVGKNIDFVVKNSLCTGCATCAAICPEDAIITKYNSKKGTYEPTIDHNKCTDCEICVMACPGFELDLYDKPETQKELPNHELIGSYKGIWRAYTLNDQIRERASSGGLITQVLIYLLEKGLVDGVIVTRMNPDKPLETLSYIAHNQQELIPSQKSKYCPTPLNTILKPIIREETKYKRLAYVGLPSHVHGLRLIQKIYPELIETIPYVFSSFTAHVPSRHATEFLLYANHIPLENIKAIEYRGGDVPGRFCAILKDDTQRLVPHLHWSYSGHNFPIFFYPPREWLYFDKLSELADFSMGDNWQKWTNEPKGASTVVTRSEEAEKIIQNMIKEEILHATPMTVDDLIKDQGLHKKLNIGIRLKVWSLLGRKVPIYTHNLPVRWQDFPRTLKFAVYVLLCEYSPPFWFMKPIIYWDYIISKIICKNLKKGVTKMLSPIKKIIRALSLDKPKQLTKSKTFKIVMIGGFGWRDIGDEAMPHADRLNLKSLLDNEVEIVMLSPNPEYTNDAHNERAILDIQGISAKNKSSLKERIKCMGATLIFLLGAFFTRYGIRLRLWDSARNVLDELSDCDLLFNVGGGNLNSLIAKELYKKCTTYLACKILGKPVIVSGQTMGPFRNNFDKFYANFCLNTVHLITLRDKDVSKERLSNIGVSKPKIFDTADDAMTLPFISREKAIYLLEQETSKTYQSFKNCLLIFMNLKGSLKIYKGSDGDSSLGNEIKIMAQIADQIINDFSATIIFLPTDYCEGVDDRVLHREIISLMKFPEKAFSIEKEYNDTELKGIIALADVAIGARYHFNVFAASLLVPFLGIASGEYQRTKLKGLADLCQLPQCFVEKDMEVISFDEAWKQVATVINDRQEIKKRLSQNVPILLDKSLLTVKEAVVLLKVKNEKY